MRPPPSPQSLVPTESGIAELWVAPDNIASRDLFHGPGGSRLVPKPDAEFQFKGLDKTGSSRGYDVVDGEGRKWDVKIGEEAQPEVVVSRLLWAVGFHQPVTYYVPTWKLVGGPNDKPPAPGRFRLAADHKSLGYWSWHENPFVGTRQFRGLVVANLIVNNWDFKTNNTRLYAVEEDKVSPGSPSRWFVVQDIGASLGMSGWPVGTIDHIRHFESQDLVRRVRKDGTVKFDYHGRHTFVLDGITPGDVVWICALFDKLSDAQFDDAFRAAEYPKDLRERFIRKIREKVRQGLALEAKEGRG